MPLAWLHYFEHFWYCMFIIFFRNWYWKLWKWMKWNLPHLQFGKREKILVNIGMGKNDRKVFFTVEEETTRTYKLNCVETLHISQEKQLWAAKLDNRTIWAGSKETTQSCTCLHTLKDLWPTGFFFLSHALSYSHCCEHHYNNIVRVLLTCLMQSHFLWVRLTPVIR